MVGGIKNLFVSEVKGISWYYKECTTLLKLQSFVIALVHHYYHVFAVSSFYL